MFCDILNNNKGSLNSLADIANEIACIFDANNVKELKQHGHFTTQALNNNND
jgi:hypothetical protein